MCKAVDIDACHILLERSWHYDVSATHKSKENIYMFNWKGKRVSMRPIPPAPKPTKEEDSKFTSICNQGELFMEPKEVKQGIVLEKISPTAEVLKEENKPLEEFKEVVYDKFVDILPHP